MNCQNDMGEVSTQTGSDSKKSHCLESHKLPPHSITLTAWPPSLKPHFQAQAAFNMWIWSSLPALNLLMITFKIMFKWLAEWLSMIWSLPLSLGHSFSHFLLLSIKSLAVPYKIWDYKLNFSFRWKKKSFSTSMFPILNETYENIIFCLPEIQISLSILHFYLINMAALPVTLCGLMGPCLPLLHFSLTLSAPPSHPQLI